jgi:hypothetical protein
MLADAGHRFHTERNQPVGKSVIPVSHGSRSRGSVLARTSACFRPIPPPPATRGGGLCT